MSIGIILTSIPVTIINSITPIVALSPKWKLFIHTFLSSGEIFSFLRTTVRYGKSKIPKGANERMRLKIPKPLISFPPPTFWNTLPRVSVFDGVSCVLTMKKLWNNIFSIVFFRESQEEYLDIFWWYSVFGIVTYI